MLAIGPHKSGLTSRIVLPSIIKCKLPIIFFGRKFDATVLSFLDSNNKYLIDINTPSDFLNLGYQKNWIYCIETFCSKINLSAYLNNISYQCNVIIDELELINSFSLQTKKLLEFTNLIITMHSIATIEPLSSFIDKFNEVISLNADQITKSALSRFKNIKSGIRDTFPPYFNNKTWSDNYLWTSLPNECKSILVNSIKDHQNILVVSRCGDGKTTVLQSLTSKLKEIYPTNKISIIQETEEIVLQTNESKVLSLSINKDSLVNAIKSELNNNPDHIVIGELRFNEIEPVLNCNTHWMSSMFSASKNQVLSRIESNPQITPSKELIAKNVNIIVMVSMFEIIEITRLLEWDEINASYKFQPLYSTNS